MNKKRILFLVLLITSGVLFGQSRKIIYVPNIPGYQTLKCDFHLHTIFSDGTVWPTVRVEEAWQEGLDAIAISDHIEYRPHSKDIVANHNRAYEIAEPIANQQNIILIRAAEITRNMPPGHLNALFIQNANLLERDNVTDALQEAKDQGAFIVWNHPGWKTQQPDSTKWWNMHNELYNKKLLNGIEIYNSNEYYPEAFEWANEKNLTIFGDSDEHGPMGMSYDLTTSHRPLTLVFAKTRNRAGIKDALVNRRTVVYFDNTLMGKSDLLEPLFFASLSFRDAPLALKNGTTAYLEIRNNSDLDYELELAQPGVGFDAPDSLVLKAHRLTPVILNGNSDQVASMSSLNLYYRVKNMFVAPEENLVITFSFKNN